MLLLVLAQLTLVVGVMLVVSTTVFVGRDRLARTRRELRSRVRDAAPIAVVLIAVLLFNSVARQLIPDLSWIIGWEATTTIQNIEGQFVLWVQSIETTALTAYFSFVYVYGYAFLLIFPVIAYLALSNTRSLRELLTAYTLNYSIGLILYALILAYGPRNVEFAAGLLYETYPRYQLLTREVNHNTNVFPSLHTSLAVTVALMAYRTREAYPQWYPVAVVAGASVAISTMYLGIHWALDVLGGIVLAYVSVVLAEKFVGRWSVSAFLDDRFRNGWPLFDRE